MHWSAQVWLLLAAVSWSVTAWRVVGEEVVGERAVAAFVRHALAMSHGAVARLLRSDRLLADRARARRGHMLLPFTGPVHQFVVAAKRRLAVLFEHRGAGRLRAGHGAEGRLVRVVRCDQWGDVSLVVHRDSCARTRLARLWIPRQN